MERDGEVVGPVPKLGLDCRRESEEDVNGEVEGEPGGGADGIEHVALRVLRRLSAACPSSEKRIERATVRQMTHERREPVGKWSHTASGDEYTTDSAALMCSAQTTPRTGRFTVHAVERCLHDLHACMAACMETLVIHSAFGNDSRPCVAPCLVRLVRSGHTTVRTLMTLAAYNRWHGDACCFSPIEYRRG